MKFSVNEKLVLMCLVTGATDKQIAKRLDLTQAEVRGITKSLFPKLGVHNRTQAATWTWRHIEHIHNGLINGHDFKEAAE